MCSNLKCTLVFWHPALCQIDDVAVLPKTLEPPVLKDQLFSKWLSRLLEQLFSKAPKMLKQNIMRQAFLEILFENIEFFWILNSYWILLRLVSEGFFLLLQFVRCIAFYCLMSLIQVIPDCSYKCYYDTWKLICSITSFILLVFGGGFLTGFIACSILCYFSTEEWKLFWCGWKQQWHG